MNKLSSIFALAIYAALLALSHAQAEEAGADKDLASALPLRFTLQSLSSGKYLDGRHAIYEQVYIGDNPENTNYFQWDIEMVHESGIFSIKSVSSGGYLDGRSSAYSRQNGALIVADGNRDPRTDTYLQWRITRGVNGFAAFQSVSSGLYIDGRSPSHSGNQVWLSTGDPSNSRFLTWIMASIIPLPVCKDSSETWTITPSGNTRGCDFINTLNRKGRSRVCGRVTINGRQVRELCKKSCDNCDRDLDATNVDVVREE